jgi:hypothetical protein
MSRTYTDIEASYMLRDRTQQERYRSYNHVCQLLERAPSVEGRDGLIDLIYSLGKHLEREAEASRKRHEEERLDMARAQAAAAKKWAYLRYIVRLAATRMTLSKLSGDPVVPYERLQDCGARGAHS